MKDGAARLALSALVALGSVAPAARPFAAGIDSAAIERAITLGRTPGSPELARFHQAYTIGLDGPMLQRLEIITEFRRVVLASEEHARVADTGWDVREAERMLRPWRNKIALVLHVAFPPNNTYRAMPPFGVVLYGRTGMPAAGRINPIDGLQTPRYVSGQPAPPGTPILGGRVDATFDASRLDPRGVYLAGIELEGKELRRAEVDFGRIE